MPKITDEFYDPSSEIPNTDENAEWLSPPSIKPWDLSDEFDLNTSKNDRDQTNQGNLSNESNKSDNIDDIDDTDMVKVDVKDEIKPVDAIGKLKETEQTEHVAKIEQAEEMKKVGQDEIKKSVERNDVAIQTDVIAEFSSRTMMNEEDSKQINEKVDSLVANIDQTIKPQIEEECTCGKCKECRQYSSCFQSSCVIL